jgi:hypothetical protein
VRTPLCDLVGIETPVVLAPMGGAVFRGAPEHATLETLARESQVAAEQSMPRAGGVYHWASLSEDEQRELETLVELALGRPGYFAKRRGAEAARVSVDVLARFAERPTGLRMRLAGRGQAVIPPRLLDDLARGAIPEACASVLTLGA